MNSSITIFVKRTTPITSPNLRVAYLLTAAMIPLVALAAVGGLFIPGLYRDAPTIVAAMQGQDLVTLLATGALLIALLGARRGSDRATLAWIGLLGYVGYTYIGAAFSYAFNAFFLLYVALFSLSSFALVAAATGIDAVALRERFDPTHPRRSVAIFLGLLALVLTLLWLGQILPFYTTGVVPAILTLAKVNTWYVWALDLGLIVPLALLGAIWLWQQKPWGYVLAGYMLIKATTMGLALLAMNWFNLRAGQPTDPIELLSFYTVLAVSGLGLSVWFFRHCRE
jgi:hypothetical protein